MTRVAPSTVFSDLLAAGFAAPAATTMVAISGGESGWQDTELGDVNLEDSTWGPSVGLYQIRTLKSQTGTGSDRDINALLPANSSPAAVATAHAAQARAAYDISQRGTNFRPWTVFTSGRYQDFLAQAQGVSGVAASAGVPSSSGGYTTPTSQAITAGTPSPGPFPTTGPSWLPWNWGSDLANSAAAGAQNATSGLATSVLGGARQIAIEGLFAVAGLALLGVGIFFVSRPARQAITTQVIEPAQNRGAELAGIAAKAGL
jgi:hypothetical protein